MDRRSRPLWQLLLLTKDPHASVQLTCEECFALLEYEAELLVEGAALDEIRPAIVRHLLRCTQCQSEFDRWLEEMSAPSGISPAG